LPPPDGFEFVHEQVRWANYETVGGFVDFARQAVNSTVVALVAVPLTVLIASWAGYAIAFSDESARRRLIVVSIVALMIPATALWIPRFVLFKTLGLTDTLVPLMAPALMATTPFYVLIFALAYSRIPARLIESARVDGLSEVAIWRKVAWPLGRAAAAAVAVLAFVFHWSNFVDALLYLSSQANQTLPLGLRALQSLEPTNHPIMLAAAVLVTAPAAIAFLLVQRAFFGRTLEV
jgi:multiple sugar transport system permease protein